MALVNKRAGHGVRLEQRADAPPRRPVILRVLAG
jgi:hypothetical protein